MLVSLGAEVLGREGSLGHIERFIFDVQAQKVSDLVVRRGIFGHERVVSLDRMLDADPAALRLDMSEAELDDSRDFTEAGYTAPDTDFGAPPSSQDQGRSDTDFQLDELQSYGAAGTAGKPLGYPGGEVIVPEDQQLTVLSKGTKVFTVDGDEAGTVTEAAFDPADGRLVRFGLSSGGFFRQAMDVPAEWIDEIQPEGVMLTVGRENLEHLKAS